MILEAAAEAFRDRQKFVLSLAGGSTPKKLYELLAKPYYQERLDFEKTFVIWGDERSVPPTHAESNYKMAHEAWLSKVAINADNIIRVPGEMPPVEAAKTYEKTLKVLFGMTIGLPKIDFSLLGLGDDGHTASLFPGTEASKETERWAVATHVTKAPHDRVTLTFPVLNSARRTLFLVTGGDKAGIVKEVLREDLPMNRYPAQRVQPKDGDVVWLLDGAAAEKLPNAIRAKASPL